MGTKTLSRLGETGFRGEGDFPCGTASKESTCNVGDLGSISGLGKSPGEGKGYSFQYSGLERLTTLFKGFLGSSAGK